MPFDRVEDAFAAIESGKCDGYTDDGGSVAALRSTMKKPDDWDILEEVISKEPLGIHTRQGDDNWSEIVRWLHFGLLTAEESGVTKENASEMAKSSGSPTVRRLLGVEGEFGRMLGLDNDWMLRAIRVAGNYGEIYDEHFGPNGLGLPRGLNRLWNQGGLQYALPWR
jgi:general L-amino acid transport system substrate-binding protein